MYPQTRDRVFGLRITRSRDQDSNSFKIENLNQLYVWGSQWIARKGLEICNGTHLEVFWSEMINQTWWSIPSSDCLLSRTLFRPKSSPLSIQVHHLVLAYLSSLGSWFFFFVEWQAQFLLSRCWTPTILPSSFPPSLRPPVPSIPPIDHQDACGSRERRSYLWRWQRRVPCSAGHISCCVSVAVGCDIWRSHPQTHQPTLLTS